MRSRTIDVLSWNVNGLRAVARKGFLPWLEGTGAHIVAVQEVRATTDQLEPALRRPKGWRTGFVAAEKKGYSGVGFFARRAADDVRTLGHDAIDREGRVQIARFGRLTIANVYFPNGNGTVIAGRRSNDRI